MPLIPEPEIPAHVGLTTAAEMMAEYYRLIAEELAFCLPEKIRQQAITAAKAKLQETK